MRLRLLVLAALAATGAWLAPAALATTPQNDTIGGATPVGLSWTSLSAPAQIAPVQPGDWMDATANGTEDALRPTCLAAKSYRSLWYSVSVPEASVLRVSVKPDDVTVYQPVVTIIGPDGHEQACGLGGTSASSDPAATATTYAFPDCNATPCTPGLYYIRVAQVADRLPTGSGPQALTVDISGKDITPPQVHVRTLSLAQPHHRVVYDGGGSTDYGSGIDKGSASFVFADRGGCYATVNKLKAPHRWCSSGLHKVTFQIKDKAGNTGTYTWWVFVHDWRQPAVSFVARAPFPGSRTLHLKVSSSEPLRLLLLVTQGVGGSPLFRQTLYLPRGRVTRSVRLHRPVASGASLVLSGIARDMAGNATLLPQCTLDAVSGAGSCWQP